LRGSGQFTPSIFLDTLTITSENLCEASRKTDNVIFKAFNCLLHEEGEYCGRRLYDTLNEFVGKLTQRGAYHKPLVDVVNDLLTKTVPVSNPECLNKEEIQRITPLPIFRDFPELLKKEITKWERGEDFNGQISVIPDGYRGESSITIIKKKRLSEIINNKPIIVLSATEDPTLICMLLGAKSNEVEVFKPKIQIKKQVQITQVMDCMNGLVTLSKASARRRVVSQASSLMNTNLKTCLICHQQYEKEFAEELNLTPTIYRKGNPDWKDTGHYWSIKGTNAFKDYGQILVIGNPTPNPETMFRQVRALYHDYSELDERLVNPNSDIRSYGDERVNRYFNSLREGELLQAIYRIRPLERNGRKSINIILFTAQQVEGLNVTKYYPPTYQQALKIMTIKKMVTAAKSLLSIQKDFQIKDLLSTGLGLSTLYKYEKDMATSLNLKVKGIRNKRYGY
jgi:hypothetical protein